MRTRLVFAALALMGFLLPVPAAAQVASYCDPHASGFTGSCLTPPNNYCKQLGETTMDGNKQNLIACMDDGSGSSPPRNIWKPMTQTQVNIPACPSGQAISAVNYGVPTCVDVGAATCSEGTFVYYTSSIAARCTGGAWVTLYVGP